MSYSSRNCPGCASSKSRAWGTKNGFDLRCCLRCSTTFTAQLPASEEGHDYDSYYRPDNINKPEFLNRRLDELMSGFASFRQSGRLLDIGCGGGEWLNAARRAGWKAQGLEVSAPVVEYLREQDFEIFHGFLQDAAYPDNHFDMVLAIEVLEHVPDAEAILRETARILRPGGVLWATTPHGNGLSARVLHEEWSVVAPPEHLHLFSSKGMRRILRKSGFSHSRVQTQGINPFELMHGIKHRFKPGKNVADEDSNRVQSSYQLNEFMIEKSSRRLLKDALNVVLSTTQMGDSLKIRAIK